MSTQAILLNPALGTTSPLNIRGKGAAQALGRSANPLEQLNAFLTTHSKTINRAVNGGAAGFNFLTFLNGHFHFIEAIQEKLELLSEIITKIATATYGLNNAQIAFNDKNIFTVVGGALEVPIAIFSTGYNLWLRRGLAQGLNQFQAIFSRLEKRDQDGNRIKGKFIIEDFAGKGFLEGFKIMSKELPVIYREFSTNPKKFFDFSHLLLCATTFQVGGALVSFTGLTKLAAVLRNFGGAAVDLILMSDRKHKQTNVDENKEKPKSYVGAGCSWIGAEIVDLLKRFDFFSDRINNLTNLSLVFDRIAAMFFTDANRDARKKAA